VRLVVLRRGTASALDDLAKMLISGRTETGITAHSIISAGIPEEAAKQYIGVADTLWQLAQDLNAKGCDANEIATACKVWALQLAEQTGGKLVAFGIIKNAHDKLKREAAYVPVGSSPEQFLVSLKETHAVPRERSTSTSPFDHREFLEWELSTCEKVKFASQNRDILRLLASACFALHQDVQKAFNVDLWRCHDFLMAAIQQRRLPPGTPDYPDRLGDMLPMLNNLVNSQITISEEASNEPNGSARALTATLRSNAAAVWLITTLAKTLSSGNGVRNLHMRQMWLVLGTIPPQELRESTKMFAGTYFDKHLSDELVLEQWSHVNDRNVFLASLIR